MGLPSTFNGGGQLVDFAGMTQDASRNVREGPRRLQQINRHYEMQLFPVCVHVFAFMFWFMTLAIGLLIDLPIGPVWITSAYCPQEWSFYWSP